VSAGTLDWWRAWVFLGVVFGGAVASTVSVFRVNKDVLAERFKPPVQQGQPLADTIVVVLLLAGFASVMVGIPLDVFRWHLMATPGTLVSSVGLVLIVVRWWIMTLALRENAFAAPVVKHQADRHHTVIESGVYGVVRHPMYAGAVPLLVGIPLWLESYAAALLASVPIGTLVVRIVVEEQFLRRALAGYNAYTERARYRLSCLCGKLGMDGLASVTVLTGARNAAPDRGGTMASHAPSPATAGEFGRWAALRRRLYGNR
jgi:protein-S-isoprenylcysteine O-methyltransferase Ste14